MESKTNSKQSFLTRQRRLCGGSTLVDTAILGIDILEVVRAGPDVVQRSGGSVVGGIVVRLTKLEISSQHLLWQSISWD